MFTPVIQNCGFFFQINYFRKKNVEHAPLWVPWFVLNKLLPQKKTPRARPAAVTQLTHPPGTIRGSGLRAPLSCPGVPPGPSMKGSMLGAAFWHVLPKMSGFVHVEVHVDSPMDLGWRPPLKLVKPAGKGRQRHPRPRIEPRFIFWGSQGP